MFFIIQFIFWSIHVLNADTRVLRPLELQPDMSIGISFKSHHRINNYYLNFNNKFILGRVKLLIATKVQIPGDDMTTTGPPMSNC